MGCDGQVRVVCISKRFSELHALHAQIGRAWEPQARIIEQYAPFHLPLHVPIYGY
jgi:hypothetical protein